MKSTPALRRLTAAVLALTTVLTAAAPAALAAGDQPAPACDEAYYATLDYYGGLTQGSVVKSYTLHGASTLIDYGTYDEVVNLTDGTVPVRRASTTEFHFGEGAAPDRFYFEGRTAAPFESLPWTIAVSYALNGVPTRAEELAGKTGVVEIALDVLPNAAASDYAKSNYTLEAMAVFNQDDILSLEAPGAQVQLVGNLRAVLFIVLPGEEKHFTIRVGSNDFSFGGMTFLVVPATLEQLSEIAKLSQRKDELEEDYNQLSDSFDTLLETMGDLGGSLRATADGLDQLDQARDTISNGKDQLYTDGDRLREDLTALEGSLSTLPDHLKDADSAVTDLTDSLKNVTDAAVDMRDDLEEIDDCLNDLRRDLRRIRSNGSATESDLAAVGRDLDRLQGQLRDASETLTILDIRVNGGILKKIDKDFSDETGKSFITIQKKQLGEVLDQVDSLNRAWQAAGGTDDKGSTITYPAFQGAALIAAQKADPSNVAAVLGQLNAVVTTVNQAVAGLVASGMAEDAALEQVLAGAGADAAAAYQQAMVMEQVYTAVCGGTDKPMTKANFFTALLMLSEINSLPADKQTAEAVKAILASKSDYAKTGTMLAALDGDHDTEAVAGMLSDLAALLGHLGSGGLTGSLGGLLDSTGDAMGSLEDTTEAGQGLLAEVNELLDELKDLDDTVNDHVPGLRGTLQDTQSLVGDLHRTVGDTNTFLGSFRNLSQEAGGQLDAGTRQSLRNLSETLRRTARSTDSVGEVKSAKDALTGIIEDTWREYTGDVNNLLLMDATAQAQSLTSQRNAAPSSVQILLRTQEIKTEEVMTESVQAKEEAPATFWGRVARMFQDFWRAITGIFGKK